MSLPFSYSLIYKKDHLRVLSLEPARDRDADLIGSLRVTTLRDEYEELVEPYTAISYVWGDRTPVDKILLNGHELGITENLGAALRDIRDATRVRRIWTDAICIDQRNIEERNQQVAMMGQIYFHANSTIIHLGPLEPHSEFVLRAVQEAVNQDGYTTNVTDASPLKCLVMLHTILRRSFRKQKRACYCGLGFVGYGTAENDHVYDIESMNDIRVEYSRHRAHLPRDPPDPISPFWEKQEDRTPCSLRQILRTRLGCQLSDPRDAIFAHLGIISDRDEILKFVKLDYNQTIKELLTAVARALVKKGGLELLTEGITPSHPLRSILPSWVPDWRIEISQETLQREVEAISTSSLCHSACAEPFGVISASEILDVSGPPPSPWRYPSIDIDRAINGFYTDIFELEYRARRIWEEFWKTGAAAGDESSARNSSQITTNMNISLGRIYWTWLMDTRVVDAGDIVASLVSSPECLEGWEATIEHGKTVVARSCAVPGEPKFELDYMRRAIVNIQQAEKCAVVTRVRDEYIAAALHTPAVYYDLRISETMKRRCLGTSSARDIGGLGPSKRKLAKHDDSILAVKTNLGIISANRIPS
ncbi:hypothetical protein EKO27_g3216 [Xylaria grammica]|uniref:Heterokaryon incompatibility domain-containing protein n=1 Tax=Xylaria grammica TaxID=363999 RepID=A0A439DBY7_9PEZI|nr:hypothetical protein EKO27_g3216 [Xylaria grammica]